MPSQILFVVTSNHAFSPGHPTGVWLGEYAEPYVALTKAGHAVTVASPKGGRMPVDPRSAVGEDQMRDWAPAVAAAASTQPLGTVSSVGFDAIVLPGGHGPMFDLPKDIDLAELLCEFHSAGKLIGAVCHGPAGLLSARREDDHPLVEGVRLTSYTWAEEEISGLDVAVPFNLQRRLASRGATFCEEPPRSEHVVHDGQFVTGQNPWSSAAFAAKLVELLAAADRTAVTA